MMTGSTTGRVVRSAGGTRWGWCANNAGYDSLAGWMLHGANTTLGLLRKESQHSMFVAVEQRLSLIQPEPCRPTERTTPMIYLHGRILQAGQKRSVLQESEWNKCFPMIACWLKYLFNWGSQWNPKRISWLTMHCYIYCNRHHCIETVFLFLKINSWIFMIAVPRFKAPPDCLTAWYTSNTNLANWKWITFMLHRKAQINIQTISAVAQFQKAPMKHLSAQWKNKMSTDEIIDVQQSVCLFSALLQMHKTMRMRQLDCISAYWPLHIYPLIHIHCYSDGVHQMIADICSHRSHLTPTCSYCFLPGNNLFQSQPPFPSFLHSVCCSFLWCLIAAASWLQLHGFSNRPGSVSFLFLYLFLNSDYCYILSMARCLL